MARRKRRGGRRGFRVGKYINLAFKILGGLVVAGPAIRAVSENVANPANIPRDTLRNYTGVDPNVGQVDYTRLTSGVASVIGGLIIAKIGSFLARRF